MPMEMRRIKQECPECKSETVFNVDNKSIFCGKCGYERPINKPGNVVVEEKIELIPDTQIEEVKQMDQVQEIKDEIEKEENQVIESIPEVESV